MFVKQDLIQCAEVFKNCNSTQHELITNGIRFVFSMCTAPKKLLAQISIDIDVSLKMPKIKNKFLLINIVFKYVQVQLGYQPDPKDWDWKLVNHTLESVQTLLTPAPEKLLNTVFCNCNKGCTAKCGCKKSEDENSGR